MAILAILLLYIAALYLAFGFLFSLILIGLGYGFAGRGSIFYGKEIKLIILITFFWGCPPAFSYFSKKLSLK
jgi:hypothetical protein